MDNIKHFSLFDKDVVIQHYTEKDGVDISYVCTTEGKNSDNIAYDIYYRDTPHPEFGNRYFGICRYIDPYTYDHEIRITNADWVEDLSFTMIDNGEGEWTYSRYRHDYISWGSNAIDGGRSYTRIVGDNLKQVNSKVFTVKDGKFIEATVVGYAYDSNCIT